MTTYNVLLQSGATVNVEAQRFESHNGYYSFIGANGRTRVKFFDADVAQIDEGAATRETGIRIAQRIYQTRIKIDRRWI